MIDEEKVAETLKEWLENPYWAAYYDGAPSKACKQYVALSFYANDMEDEEAFAEMDQLEDKLDLSDWKHLLRFSGNDPNKVKIQKKIAEMEQ